MQLYKFIHFLFSFYFVLLSIDIISSWFPESRDYRVIQLIRRLTEPYLYFFRQFIPYIGGLDISPIIAFFALQFLEKLVVRILFF
jgi:YggT family protein